jgi:hypothetical protein
MNAVQRWLVTGMLFKGARDRDAVQRRLMTGMLFKAGLVIWMLFQGRIGPRASTFPSIAASSAEDANAWNALC